MLRLFRFWLSFTWNVCLNLVIKTLSAVPRPHFISTCSPDWDLINCSQYKGWAGTGNNLSQSHINTQLNS